MKSNQHHESVRTQELSILKPVRGALNISRQLTDAGEFEIADLIRSAAIEDVFPPSGLVAFNHKLEVVNIFLDMAAWQNGLGIIDDPRIELTHNGHSVEFLKVKNKSLRAAMSEHKNR